jgi:hypothetical protein
MPGFFNEKSDSRGKQETHFDFHVAGPFRKKRDAVLGVPSFKKMTNACGAENLPRKSKFDSKAILLQLMRYLGHVDANRLTWVAPASRGLNWASRPILVQIRLT